MKRRRSATISKGNVGASGAPPVPVELNDELRRSVQRERREKRAKRKEAIRRKRLKRSSSHFFNATPIPGDRSLTEGEGGASWVGGGGEERAKDECPPVGEKPQETLAATEHTPPSPEKGKPKGTKRTKKSKEASSCFETQFEALSKPAKESRKTRTRKSKSTSPHFHIKVKGTKKDPETSAQTISKPVKIKTHSKRSEISGIKKTKNRKAASPLKTLSTLQAENIPQTQSKVKRSKSASPRLETKIENPPATKKARSKKSKSSSPHFDIKPKKAPGKVLISHTNSLPNGMISSAEQGQASISKPRGARSRAKVVRCLEQSKEEPGTEAKEKKKRKQRSKEESVAVKKQERKGRKVTRRVQAGISTAIWPLLSSDKFGLIQEELKGDPFHLIVGTTFLNRTRGSVAIPLLRQFLHDYPTPYALSIAPIHTISAFLQPLGLYNIRATRLHNLAKTWLTTPPTFGHVTKKYNYPPRDTKPFPSSLLPTNGVEQGRGWEIAHLPGVGAYALDSWRIFCRDEFRRAAGERVELGQEEWRSVVPMDKELRVYVRWMWAKEGVRWKEPGDIQQTALSSPFFDDERAAIC